MFLFVDKILRLSQPEAIRGLFHIKPSNPYLYLNSDNQYELPLSIVGEAVGQLCGWYVAKVSQFKLMAVAGVVRGIHSFAAPLSNDCLELEVAVLNLDLDAKRVCYSGRAFVNGQLILSIEESLAPLVDAELFKNKQHVATLYNELLKGESLSYACEKVNYAECFHYDELIYQSDNLLQGYKKISEQLLCFDDHFPCRPVYPLSLLLQNKLEMGLKLIKKLIGNNNVSLDKIMINQVKIGDFINPGDVIQTVCQLKENTDDRYCMQFKTSKKNKRVSTADIVFQCN